MVSVLYKWIDVKWAVLEKLTKQELFTVVLAVESCLTGRYYTKDFN